MAFPPNYFYPIEEPPLTEEEQIERDEYECAEAQRLMDLYGPFPGRFETEWSL